MEASYISSVKEKASAQGKYLFGGGNIDTDDGEDTVMEEAAIGPIVIVDRRALDRECLARSLREHNPTLEFRTVESIEELRRLDGAKAAPSALLLILGSRKVTEQSARDEIVSLVSAFKNIPVIVIADSDDPVQILSALESGARGYIPSNVRLKVAAEAVALARAGGVFVPARAFLTLRESILSAANGARPLHSMFTAREADVVEALRQGKANKIIAYELNLCESTVKVHIRSIMRKLKATNRTEVAYKLRDVVS
ncbi:response regulator transcription factor [Mesorhizobium koreense]|jgi:DNA-binding NarL/FixJ family response regulator|uniref:response regulator transcription factor n=1 Tax=Mesorhizobium koreense TaxID=3074855 RepID=UPI00287B6F2C|nr:response regulator transcription factor [Mesorhizobium sp. WR6]